MCFFSANLIKMINGKQLILFEGFTFYKMGKKKGFNKWYCTNFPTCKSYVTTDEELYFREVNVDHRHAKKSLFKTPVGVYIRL